MAYQSQPLGPWLKGVVASNQPLAMPKGALARASNLCLMERGAVTPVDGSGVLYQFSGAIQNNRGRILAETLFAPTGITPYFIMLASVLEAKLGPPANLTATVGTSGNPNGTYHYVVTATDGVGGETTISNEATASPASQIVNLAWDVVPNAYAYRIYRTVAGGGSGTETFLAAVLQPSPLTAQVTYADNADPNFLGPFSSSAAVNDGNFATVAWTISSQNGPSASFGGTIVSQGNNGSGFIQSDGLRATGYGFTIPANATINGVVVQVNRMATNTSEVQCFEDSITLMNGSTAGANKASGTPWPSGGGVALYGSATDTWGLLLAPADVNGSGFGVDLVAELDNFDLSHDRSGVATVNSIQITVYYTPATGGGGGSGGGGGAGGGGGGGGGGGSPGSGTYPLTDTTQQTALFVLNVVGALGQTYTDANIVAYFPAAPAQLSNLITPSGGLTGIVSLLPQFKQFTNRLIMTLGNGFPIQALWDNRGTVINPAPVFNITAASKSADQVTFTVAQTIVGDPTNVGFLPVGSNITVNTIDTSYDGVFVVIAVGTNTITIRNVAASGATTTGTAIVTTTPLISTFNPQYAIWAASTAYAIGSVIVPLTQSSPAIYLTAVQGGTSGASQPSWPSGFAPGKDIDINDGSVIWHVSGLLNSAAPPPPGAGHIEVYANCLWAFDTAPANTSTGIDGPCALRQSSVGNPFSWNPVNQAFLDKDDGFEGMGLAKFTITALGIPPEGSLIAFKNRTPYQVIGVFGASNFAIQAVSSDMGCVAPRTAEFVPGYGIVRLSHLGYAVFDGVRDTLISEQIRPYLFSVNDLDARDITTVNSAATPLSWAAQTANPPQYCIAMPVNNMTLTRIFQYDLVLKAWMVTDLPFSIDSMAQVEPAGSAPITLLGGYLDGCLQQWQAGDLAWYTGGTSGGGVTAPIAVTSTLRLPTIASQDSSQRVFLRRLVLRGTNAGAKGTIIVTPRISLVAQTAITVSIGANADFDCFVDVGLTGVRFDATVSTTSHIELDGVTWMLEPRPSGVPVAAI